MLLPFDIHPNAAADLRVLRKEDLIAFSRIGVALRELACNSDLQDALMIHGADEDTEAGRIEVKKWIQAWRQGNELWSLKICDIGKAVQALPYRLIFAHHPWSQSDPRSYYQLLAIVHRSFDFDIRSDIARRIESDYLGLRDIVRKK